MSAVRSLSGANRTWHGHVISVANDPKRTKTDQFEVFIIGGGKYVPLATPPIGP
jgi:hypothetical protein